MSHKPFAVDLGSFRDGELYSHGNRFSVHARIDAVWYRRKDGETRACVGALGLWSQNLKQEVDPADPIAVLTADLDSRYGGDCHARWDGTGYWGAEEPEVVREHLALLRPMLEDFPVVPDGYDGWWTFR